MPKHSKTILKGILKLPKNIIKKFISKGFNDPKVYSNYAILCKESLRENEALDLLIKSTDRYPDNPESHAIISDILRSQGKLEEAQFSIEKAINIKPDVADYHFNLGLIFIGLRILSKAIMSLQKAILINPNLIEAYLNLCSVHMDLSNFSEAESSIKKSNQTRPKLFYRTF